MTKQRVKSVLSSLWEANVENGKKDTHTSAQRIMGNHQLIIITQLLQVVDTMESIDELFTWLSEMIMQRMDVQVVQFWTMQVHAQQQMSCELRTMARQNTACPQHIVVNQPLANTVEKLLHRRQSVTPRLVGHVFSQYHSKLLTRYNLNYWACHVMSSDILLPPGRNDFSYEKVATPFTLGVAVFLQHAPSSRLLPTLAHILEHVLPIAMSRGLLNVTTPMKQELQLSIAQYTGRHAIPTRFAPQHIQAEHSTKHALIPKNSLQENNIRRLYFEIDGKRTIGELVSIMQMSTQEFYAALSLLLTQKRIRIADAGGRTVRGLQSLQSSLIPRVQ